MQYILIHHHAVPSRSAWTIMSVQQSWSQMQWNVSFGSFFSNQMVMIDIHYLLSSDSCLSFLFSLTSLHYFIATCTKSVPIVLSSGDSAVSATRVGALPLATGSGGAFGDISSEFENLLGEATRIACDHTKKTPNTVSKNGHDSPSGQDANPSSLRVHYNFNQ